MSKMSFTVIFGLTADPIHKGHEQAIINGVEYCRDNGIDVEKFLLIPVYQPNLIADKKSPVASFEQRLYMCELVADRLSKQLDCDIEVSRIEEKLFKNTGQANYSFNTIQKLNLKNLLFMVSADHFAGRWPKFRQWYNWREILRYSGLLINHRSGHKLNLGFIQHLKEINPEIFIVENSKTIEISSSQIRSKKANIDVRKYLSEDVFQFVISNGIY